MLKNEAEEELNIERKDLKYKYDYKVNRNILIGIIRNEIIDIFLNDSDINLYCEKLKERIKKNLISIRQNRSFPRVYKRGKHKVNRLLS